jgi:ribosome-associated protein
MADFLHQELKALGIKVTVEGTKDSDWILVDCNGIVVVHLFKPETRQFYNLEKMWQSN